MLGTFGLQGLSKSIIFAAFLLSDIIVKRITIIFTTIVMLATSAAAQRSTITEVKKAISGLTMTVDSYNKAFNKLNPTFTNDETRNRAETWELANRIKIELYDKYMDNRRVGKKVDAKLMGHALLDGYDYGQVALKLDTVYILDNNGQRIIDKKSKRPKVRTKYSKDIAHRLMEHHDDYRLVGSELYNVKDWNGAYQSWEYYCQLAARDDDARWSKPDSLVGEVRYYQAIAAWQKADTLDAVRLFEVARQTGYDRKEAYDYALICLNDLGREQDVVKLAWEAFVKFGTSDPQYIRILINSYLAREDFSGANDLVDDALAANPDDDELYNLKGLVVENHDDIYEAFPYYQRCIELNDSNASGLFNVGRYFYNKAQETRQNSHLYGKRLANLVNPMYREALPYLEKSYAINPDNKDLVNALRDIYFKLGEADKLQAIESAQ